MPWMKANGVVSFLDGSVCLRTVYEAARTKRLRVARIGEGRCWVTSERWVRDWLEAASGESESRPEGR